VRTNSEGMKRPSTYVLLQDLCQSDYVQIHNVEERRRGTARIAQGQPKLFVIASRPVETQPVGGASHPPLDFVAFSREVARMAMA